MSDQEHKSEEMMQSEGNKEKRLEKTEQFRDMWDNIQWVSMQLIGVPEGEKKQSGAENIFEKKLAKKTP